MPWLCLLLLAPALPAQAPEPPAPLRRVMDRWQLDEQEFALLAVDAASGAPLLAHHPDRPLRPASTLKLMTTACALEHLGPSHRFETLFRADHQPRADGRLSGSLYVVGGGDPLLRAEDLWVALREVAALGVKEITGDLILDDHLFGPPARPASWPPVASSNPYDAGQRALSLAWNSIEVIVRPGATAGAPARVSTFPLAAGVVLAGEPQTGAETDLEVRFVAGGKGRPGQVLVRGTIAAGAAPFRRWIRLGHPEEAIGAAIVELLGDVGIGFEGAVRTGSPPPRTVILLRHRSRSLAEIVTATNKFSSNFAAEILLRQLAVRPGGPPATTRAGLAVLAGCLERWDVDPAALTLADGSGLAPADRLTARSLVQVLARARRSAAWGPELLASLPRAGEDGTLRRRLKAYRGRLRAKTGSLHGVASLAGQLVLRDGRQVLLAILVQREAGKTAPPALVDDLLEALERALIDALERQADGELEAVGPITRLLAHRPAIDQADRRLEDR